MAIELSKLADLFVTEVSKVVDRTTKLAAKPKAKAKGKVKLNRKQMAAKLEKDKFDFKKLKGELEVLEADDGKIKSKLEETRTFVNAARKSILKLHDALEKLDLADSNEAYFYDDDVAYVVDGKECHMEVDGEGNITLTPMSKHRKSKKQEAEVEVQCADDGCQEGSHGHDAPGASKDEDEDHAMADDQELLDLLNSTLSD